MESKASKLQQESVPIVLVGLPYSGKTTLVNMLKEKRFTRPKPTEGLIVDTIEIENTLLNIYDISGNEYSRKNLWEPNILTSLGIIFVIDSSDRAGLKETSHWYWKIIKEWLSDSYSDKVVLLLINKSDLKSSISLDKIIKEMKLDKMGSFSNISFQFFKTSLRNDHNIDFALKWLMGKIQNYKELRFNKFRALIISDILGNPLYIHDPEKIAQNTSMFVGYIRALSGFANEIFGHEKFKVLKVDENHFFISEIEDNVVLIAVDQEEALPEARRISILIHDQLRNKDTDLENTLNTLLNGYVK